MRELKPRTAAERWMGHWGRPHRFVVDLPRRGGIVALTSHWRNDIRGEAYHWRDDGGPPVMFARGNSRELGIHYLGRLGSMCREWMLDLDAAWPSLAGYVPEPPKRRTSKPPALNDWISEGAWSFDQRWSKFVYWVDGLHHCAPCLKRIVHTTRDWPERDRAASRVLFRDTSLACEARVEELQSATWEPRAWSPQDEDEDDR